MGAPSRGGRHGRWRLAQAEPSRCRRAHCGSERIEPSLGIRLLMDLKTVFGSDDALHTKTILAKLIAIEESPWGDLRGKPLDDRGLAKGLREYSIQPDTIRIGEIRLKGYKREALADAWVRYASPAYPETSVTRVTSVTTQQNQGSLVTVPPLSRTPNEMSRHTHTSKMSRQTLTKTMLSRLSRLSRSLGGRRGTKVR